MMMYQVKGILYCDPVPYVFYRMILAYVYEAQNQQNVVYDCQTR